MCRLSPPTIPAALIALSASLLLAAPALADDRLEGIACRSVHLAYDAPESAAFVSSVTVRHSAPGTYFCVCGFQMGYFGIQELDAGRKVAIFSVWDPGQQDNPDLVPDQRKVQVLDVGPGVRVQRFGNEGTGAQSFLDLDWQVGQTIQCAVTARLEGDRTAFAAFVKGPADDAWHPLATFATLAQGRLIQGHYAFVEDFRRDRVSATLRREAEYGPGHVATPTHQWQPLARARFTADSNPALTIDAGTRGTRFFLATGGKTGPPSTPLREWIQVPGTPFPGQESFPLGP